MASEDGYFSWYAEHAKNLRIALVGYGVGFLALIVSNESALKALKASESPRLVALLFLIAIAIQIALVLINKYLAWQAYDMERKSEGVGTKRRARIERWSEAIYFDLGFDVLSGIMLFVGTYYLIVGTL